MLIIERDHIFNARATMSTSSTFLPPKSMAIKTFMNANFRCRSTWDEATFRSTFVSASASLCQRHCVSASQRHCVSVTASAFALIASSNVVSMERKRWEKSLIAENPDFFWQIRFLCGGKSTETTRKDNNVAVAASLMPQWLWSCRYKFESRCLFGERWTRSY